MPEREDEFAVVINATKDQINILKGSILWADIVAELKRWVEMFKAENSNTVADCIRGEISGATTIARLSDIHGRERTIDYLLSIPDIFLQILEDRDNESGHK